MDTQAQQLQVLMPVLSAFSFVLGTMIGSFLNVCVCRLPKGESVVSPPSRCPKCLNRIAWYDNIPIVSWLILGAKCRNCGLPISWQYPLVEAITGTLFLLVFWRFGMHAATPVYMVLAAALVLVTFIDLTDWTIPNEVTFPGIPIGIVCALVAMFYPDSGLRVIGPFVPVFDSLLGVLVGGGIIYALDKVTLLVLKKPGMGFGDVKLMAMLGAFFGVGGAFLVIVLASFIGSTVGVIQILVGRSRSAPPSDEEEDGSEGDKKPAEAKGSRVGTHYLPFGPSLSVAGLIVMFYGPEIVNAYFAYLDMPVS